MILLKKTGLVSLLLGWVVLCAYPQDTIVSIPDTVFLYALIEEGVDTNGDSLISYGEAESVNSLGINGKGISNLQGLEAFSNLDSLTYRGQGVKYFDASKCKPVKYLSCETSFIEEINLSENTNLRELHCGGLAWGAYNFISNLDVSSCTNLEILTCSGILITELDLSANPKLKDIECAYNDSLRKLNIQNCTLLKKLDISGNRNLTICVWTDPFQPEEMIIEKEGCKYVNFTTECALGIEEKTISNVSVYPNPTNSFLTIEADISDVHHVEIRSLNGQQLLGVEMEESTHQLDLSSFQPGAYMLTIRSKNQVVTRKVIKL